MDNIRTGALDVYKRQLRVQDVPVGLSVLLKIPLIAAGGDHSLIHLGFLPTALPL